jgi:hypothetical protein
MQDFIVSFNGAFLNVEDNKCKNVYELWTRETVTMVQISGTVCSFKWKKWEKYKTDIREWPSCYQKHNSDLSI